jgi:hypothetical protein
MLLDHEGFECHVMPDETAVFYRDPDHSYWRDVKAKPDGSVSGAGRLTGVSTVVKPLDFNPDGLLGWAARLTCEGVAQLAADGREGEDPDDIRTALAWLDSGESINGALKAANLTWADLRDQAATRGTNVHLLALHALARGAAVPDFDALTEEEQGYARGVLAFWHEHEPEPFQSEQVVWSATHGVAGRLDLRCGLDADLVLLDAKTATSDFVPAKHHGQLAGYELLAVECGFCPTDRQVMLRVDADGGYELIDSTAGPEDFLAALTVYRASARISRESKAARKAVAA